SITSIDDLSVVKGITVTVTSPSSNVDVLNASQDESGSGLWFFMFTPDIEGQYTVDIDAADAVDNIGSTQTFIYVDDTPSNTTIDSSLTSAVLTTNADSLADDNSLLLFGDITDNRTLGSNVTINVQDWLSTTVQSVQTTEIMATTNSIGTWEVDYLFPARAYGEYPVLAGSEDFVGNQITETLGILMIDDFGPWSDVTMSKTDIVSGSNTINGTVNDIRYDNSGRVFHFHFDEANGSTEFVDSTQKKFLATCSGGECPTAGVGGQYETAVSFNGSTNLLQVAADDTFSMTNSTLMAWVNPAWGAGSNGYNPTILAVDDGVTTNFRWQLADDYSAMVLATDSGTESIPIAINPNEWTHLALTLEGGAWTGYVNGISTEPITQSFGIQTGLPFNIGAANETSGNFTGLIDEVVVYSHALLLEEIYDIANPLATTIAQLEIQARHLNGAIWPEVNPEGLKMYLPLDDPNGVTDFNHTSMITQTVSCDDENNGCPSGGVPGAFSSSTAVQFDGNDYIAIPDSEDLDLEQIAISFWVKAPTTSNNDYLITKGRNGWTIRFAFQESDGRILFETPGLKAPNNVWGHVGGPKLTDDQWHHVVAMYDGESKIVYVDGNKVIDAAVTGSLRKTDQPLTLGSTSANGRYFTGSDTLVGAMDEVAIFNRPLTEDEIQTLYTWNTWQTVTLDSPNSFYSTWTTTIPDGLEGLYTVGLRATDSVGNQLVNPEAWTGPIDLRAPRLSFDYISLPDDNVQTHCAADDLNITDNGWVCPAGDPINETKQASDWFVDYFTPMTRTVGLQSSAQTFVTTSDGTFTACDLHNNCRTLTMPKQSVAEGLAILSPINGTVLTNYDPITISGFAWSDQEIRQVNVLVNGQTIDVHTWSYSQGSTRGAWSTTWTPTPGESTFELEAILLTTEYQGNGFNPAHDGVFIDQSEVILVAPSLFIDKSVIPDLADIGETVTYTIVVANNGLNSLEDVAIVDTLPVGVTP
ncbi:MAG: DUF11 domain-containing protein, partial [Chloroflexi bacterium]|nr:DUF11 domain-containing protein [Chloroflexota bacterium]